MGTFHFFGDIVCLEIARGYDGLLRGDPEPVLIAAAYLINPPYLHVVGRTLHRFQAAGPFPSVASTPQPRLPVGSIEIPGGVPRWVVLAIALEDDGGKDVQRLFGAVERPQSLSVWAPEGPDIEPMSVGSLPETPEWLVPRPVHLLVDGQAASTTCRSDKWIGAVCWLMAGRPSVQLRRLRLPFLAEDRRNDWTVIIDLAH